MNPFRTFLPVIFFAVLLADAAQAQQQESAEVGVEAPPATTEAPAPDRSSANEEGPNIYPWLAAGLVAQDVPVIDVRSAEEVAETGILVNAVNIPHTDTAALIEFIGQNRDRTVVLYCDSGSRAALVLDTLREQGYHNLVNAGGYEDLAETLEQR